MEVAEEDGDAEAAASPTPTFPCGNGFLCISSIVTLAELRVQEEERGGKIKVRSLQSFSTCETSLINRNLNVLTNK